MSSFKLHDFARTRRSFFILCLVIIGCPVLVAQDAAAIGSKKKLGGKINSNKGDLAPSVTADGNLMIFQSNRPGGVGDYDLYLTVGGKDNWEDPKNLESLNSKTFDGMPTISADGNQIFFGSNRGNKNTGNIDLYHSKKNKDGWQKPVKMKNVNSKGYEGTPMLSFDGKTLYFASNRGGNQDIYFSRIKKDGSWAKPKNMGKEINTDANELNPNILHDNNFFYFSSDRDGTLGGFDLYYTRRAGNSWDPPVNLGIPVNDDTDQFYFAMPATGEYIYTSSGVSAEHTDDIYELIIPDWLKPTPIAMIKGVVLDADSKEPLVANVQVFNDVSKKLYDKDSGDNGEFLVILKTGSEYRLNFVSQGYYYYSKSINVKGDTKSFEEYHDIYLNPIKIGSKILENMVFFQTGKAKLTDESVIALDQLITLMNDNPSLNIRVEAFTDRRGQKKKNMQLSQARAETVLNYLTDAGVEEGRLKAVGRGPTGPKEQNTARLSFKKLLSLQRSRRADFIVVE